MRVREGVGDQGVDSSYAPTTPFLEKFQVVKLFYLVHSLYLAHAIFLPQSQLYMYM